MLGRVNVCTSWNDITFNIRILKVVARAPFPDALAIFGETLNNESQRRRPIQDRLLATMHVLGLIEKVLRVAHCAPQASSILSSRGQIN